MGRYGVSIQGIISFDRYRGVWIKKIHKIAKSLNYRVMQINELPEEKPEHFCMWPDREDC